MVLILRRLVFATFAGLCNGAAVVKEFGLLVFSFYDLKELLLTIVTSFYKIINLLQKGDNKHEQSLFA